MSRDAFRHHGDVDQDACVGRCVHKDRRAHVLAQIEPEVRCDHPRYGNPPFPKCVRNGEDHDRRPEAAQGVARDVDVAEIAGTQVAVGVTHHEASNEEFFEDGCDDRVAKHPQGQDREHHLFAGHLGVEAVFGIGSRKCFDQQIRPYPLHCENHTEQNVEHSPPGSKLHGTKLGVVATHREVQDQTAGNRGFYD